MLEKTFSLSCKTRITADHKKMESIPQNHVKFYLKYSSFVLRALKKRSFQKFLHWMLQKEKIEEQKVRAVQVKVLPIRKDNGKGLAGKCDTTQGRIRIYPKTMKFCKIFKQKFGLNTLLIYAGNRARVALMHELLHLKYKEDEKTVRDLAKEYFFNFTEKHTAQNSKTLCTNMMIFRTKSDEKKPLPKSQLNTNVRLTKKYKKSHMFKSKWWS
jgi:hypothetical protein